MRASAAAMASAGVRSEPLMPSDAISSFAMKSEKGSSVEKWRLAMCCGCFSATSSMSMPPMSLKIITGRRATPSQVTPT